MDSIKVTYDSYNKIWSGPEQPPLYNLEHHSVGSIIYGQMRMHPNTVIQIDDVNGKTVTNNESLMWAKRIALYFKKMGLRHDDVVGIAARNTTYITSVVLGCLFNGTPFHGVNPNFQEATIKHCFNITKPQIIFCDGCDYEIIRNATKSFKPIIYTVSEHIEGVPSVLDLLEPNKLENTYQPEKLFLGADQTVAILCSSGTTGLPKAVTISGQKLTFANPFFNSETVFYTPSGLDWMTGLYSTLSNCYSSCTRIISRKPFSPEYFVELVQKYKITSALVSPAHLVALRECPSFTTKNASSLQIITCGGGHVSSNTLDKILSILPRCMICFGYGLTEAGGVSHNINNVFPGNSVGKLIPNVRVRIVDEDGKNLGPNEVGEIYVRPSFNWMGYYGNPMETQRAMDSMGWHHTGDLGYMNDDGCMYIVDRKKEIYKYQGVHFWPGEIETAIRELPDVVECCVVAIFDERFGDLAGALVIRAKGSRLTEEQIVNHVRQRLVDPQKQLHNGVYFVDQLPHNNNGKILKREAKEILKSLMK